MRRAALIAAAALALAGAARAAQTERILLPSVRTPLVPGPPLLGNAASGEVRFPGHVTSTERVLVGVDATGAPVSLVVVQRLRIARLGDYTFTVAGPVDDVAAAAGSDSEPGLRKDAIVWSGFSAGNKLLAARATLRVADAEHALPLRIRRVGDTVVLENATAAEATLLRGPVSERDARIALRETARALVPDRYVAVPRTPQGVRARVLAPLAVRGTVGATRVAATLGAAPLVLHAPSTAKLALVVTPVRPDPATVPGDDLLERVSRARTTVARVLQYGEYLANPDPAGRSTATYVYASASAVRPPSAAPARKHGGGGWETIAIAAACVVGVGGLAVLWAHS